MKKKMREIFKKDNIIFKININLGEGCSKVYGCDLTEEYVKENASYYSS